MSADQSEDSQPLEDEGGGFLLFDPDALEPWRAEWVGMPEFSQEDLSPRFQLVVSFASKGDLDDFSRLIGQPLTIRTRSVWHPSAEIGHYANKRFADES